MYLRNVDATLTSLAEVRGFRNFVKAKAHKVGIIGYIQRYHADDLKLGFEGTDQQCREFFNWLKRLRTDYHMIELFDFIVHAAQRDFRMYDSFDKITDRSRLQESGGTVRRGPHSDGDLDKVSEFSDNRAEFFGTRSPV